MRTGDESREATIVHIVPPFFSFPLSSIFQFPSLAHRLLRQPPRRVAVSRRGGNCQGTPSPPSASIPFHSLILHLATPSRRSSQVPPSGNSPIPLHGYPTPSSNPREDPHAPSKRPETLRRHRRSLERLRTPSNASEPLRPPSNTSEPFRTPSDPFERLRAPSKTFDDLAATLRGPVT